MKQLYNMVELLSSSYNKNKVDVLNDLIKTESEINAYQFAYNKKPLNNSYFLLSAGKLSEVYKNEVKK